MNLPVRYIVAVVLLVFAWKGSSLDISWPPEPFQTINGPEPDAKLMKWAEPLRDIVPKMLPADRQYLANFYDAMAFVLLKDGDRDPPIVSTSDQFVVFHANSLRLAIEREKVGKYPGLGEAIDEVFFNAAGAESKAIDSDTRSILVAACGVLSWSFAIHRDE
jgi:hypothetical protein